MQDSKKHRPDSEGGDSDATSKETLADLEKNEKSSNLEGTTGEVPSPDGGAKEVRNKTDDAGPM
jgi:hypothetical protein